jgi:hypothetical protein
MYVNGTEVIARHDSRPLEVWCWDQPMERLDASWERPAENVPDAPKKRPEKHLNRRCIIWVSNGNNDGPTRDTQSTFLDLRPAHRRLPPPARRFDPQCTSVVAAATSLRKRSLRHRWNRLCPCIS